MDWTGRTKGEKKQQNSHHGNSCCVVDAFLGHIYIQPKVIIDWENPAKSELENPAHREGMTEIGNDLNLTIDAK